MKKQVLAIIISILAFGPAWAQKSLTVKDAVLRAYDTLGVEKLNGLNWVGESYKYYYYGIKEKMSCIVIKDAEKETIDSITLADLNRGIMVFNGSSLTKIPHPSFTRFPSFHSWEDDQTARFLSGNFIYLYNINNKSLYIEHELPDGAANLDVYVSGHAAFTVGNNFFVKPDGNSAIQVTNDTAKGVVNGTSVHRDEFGIHKGTFWSPSGSKIAFYRMDESMVTEYPIYVLGDMPASARFIRYPFAGKKSHEVTVGIYDLKSKKTIYLNTGEPKEQYLTNIEWSKDEKHIHIAVVNRAQNGMSLRRFKVSDGEQDLTLFTEADDKFFEPENPVYWVDNKQFIWQSERNGYNHLYLYDAAGELKLQLTDGRWVVTSFLGTDKKGKTAYFMATKENDLNNNLYSVDLSTAKITLITYEDGVHNCIGSYDKKYWIDQYSSPSVPNVQQIRGSDGKLVRALIKSKNPLQDYNLGETSVFKIKSTDGSTDLYCRMIKPANFNPANQYPVLVYLYGGPHLQLIRNSWLNGADLWLHYMAQQGYVVFSLDNRGSSNRGFAFESAVHRQLGTLEMEDQLAGVEYLKSQSFVDPERMAVYGWSFGGFMSTSLMTRKPGTFKVGVAGGPVIDWSMYEVMYTERYMDTPEENPDGYHQNNLLNYVQNLEGKLLLIHGSSDDVVLWQHSLLYIKKSVRVNKQVDYFVYPEHMHNVRGADRVHLMQKITDYINSNL